MVLQCLAESLCSSDPDYLSLDEFVLNTEAHPLRLPIQGPLTSWTSPWTETEEDTMLARDYADPSQESYEAVGMGTAVQQQLCQVMS